MRSRSEVRRLSSSQYRYVEIVGSREKHTGIIGHKGLDPRIPGILHIGLSSVEIRQRYNGVSFPAIVPISRVVGVVVYQTVRMVVTLRWERIEDAVVDAGARSIVCLYPVSQTVCLGY